MAAKRIHSIDLLRGIVMILMTLGHARHFFLHYDYSPTNIGLTSPVLYLIRWITHICAPAFVFLAGVSIFFINNKKQDKRSTSIFLLKRGIWLILLEVTVLTFFWHTHFDVIQLQVIWAIGAVFLIMACLIHLPWMINLILAVVLIASHNALELLDIEKMGSFGRVLATLLYAPGQIQWGRITVDVLYSILPYTGIMLFGFCIGPVFHKSETDRKRLFLWLGIGMIALFCLLRSFNIYGDPYRWSIQESGTVYSVMSFLNITKYPPSFQFILFTLGISFLLLVALERQSDHWMLRVRRLGQVAMFYYLVHIPVVRIASKAYSMVHTGNPPYWLFFTFWVILLVPLIIVSQYYSKWKEKKKGLKKFWWLSYL